MIAGAPARLTRGYPKVREEVLEHLWRRFPAHCIVMTDPQTRGVIDLALQASDAQLVRRRDAVSRAVDVPPGTQGTAVSLLQRAL